MNNKRNEQELTERLYETDGFIRSFEATVIECIKIPFDKYQKNDIYGIVLDRTAFFPEGGGQKCDEGTICQKKVLDVQIDEDGKIVHYLEGDINWCEGMKVKGDVDFEIRFPRMQNHSAEHIVSGIVHEKYGYENVGFHMSDKTVRFDFDGPLSKEEMDFIENIANEFVYKNIPITVSFPTAEEIGSIEYRSKLDITEGVRLVTIEGADVCACCAPHVDTTGQIGAIKIIDVMPHRQGCRITMVAGINALCDYKMLQESNGKIMALLSSKRETTAEYTRELLDRNNKLKEENTALKKEMTSIISANIIEGLKKRSSDDIRPEVIFSDILDNVGMRNLINDATEIFDGVVAGFIGDDNSGYRYIISTSDVANNDIVGLSKALNRSFSGKGGGNANMVQGSLVGKREEMEKFVKSF